MSGAEMCVLVDTGSEMNLLSPKHLDVLQKGKVPLTLLDLPEPYIIRAGIVSAYESATQKVRIHRLRFNVRVGHVSFENVEL